MKKLIGSGVTPVGTTAKSEQGHLLMRPVDRDAHVANLKRHVAAAAQLDRDLGEVKWGPGQVSAGRSEILRQKQIVDQFIADGHFILSNCQLVKPPKDASVAAIDCVITIQRYDADGNPKRDSETYLIGGYGSTNLRTSPPTLSYDSLLVSALMGQKVDLEREHEEVMLETGLTYVELRDIQLPATMAKLKLAA